MKTVFLSGPYYTGRSEFFKNKTLEKAFLVKHNIKTAKAAARYLRDKGYNVFCPHLAIAGYCDDWTDNNSEHRTKILKMCAQWIEICEYFAVIPGWQKSDGCRFEYAIAEANDKKIISLTYGQIGV